LTVFSDYHETCKDTFYEQICVQARARRKKAWCYNTRGQFFFGPKLSDTTAYSETDVETIKTADAFRIIIRLKYTRLVNKYIK